MKITDTLITHKNQSATAADTDRTDKDRAAPGKAAGRDDTLTLSAPVATDHGDYPEPDTLRVSAFRQAVLTGTYAADAEQIAHKLHHFFSSRHEVNTHENT